MHHLVRIWFNVFLRFLSFKFQNLKDFFIFFAYFTRFWSGFKWSSCCCHTVNENKLFGSLDVCLFFVFNSFSLHPLTWSMMQKSTPAHCDWRGCTLQLEKIVDSKNTRVYYRTFIFRSFRHEWALSRSFFCIRTHLNHLLSYFVVIESLLTYSITRAITNTNTQFFLKPLCSLLQLTSCWCLIYSHTCCSGEVSVCSSLHLCITDSSWSGKMAAFSHPLLDNAIADLYKCVQRWHKPAYFRQLLF